MDQYHPVCVSVSRLRLWLGNCTTLAGTHLIRGISRKTLPGDMGSIWMCVKG